MCSCPLEEPTFSPRAWRENLLQRLLYVVIPTAGLALVAALSGTSNQQRAVLLGTVGCAIGWLVLVAFQREWPYVVRAGSLVSTFVLATFVTYFLVGFHGNAALRGGRELREDFVVIAPKERERDAALGVADDVEHGVAPLLDRYDQPIGGRMRLGR